MVIFHASRLNGVPRSAENLPQQFDVGFATLNLQKMQRFTRDHPFITVFTITPWNWLTFRVKDAVMVLCGEGAAPRKNLSPQSPGELRRVSYATVA
jgi:hypothetical protein